MLLAIIFSISFSFYALVSNHKPSDINLDNRFINGFDHVVSVIKSCRNTKQLDVADAMAAAFVMDNYDESKHEYFILLSEHVKLRKIELSDTDGGQIARVRSVIIELEGRLCCPPPKVTSLFKMTKGK